MNKGENLKMKYIVYGIGQDFQKFRYAIDGEIVGYVDRCADGKKTIDGHPVLTLEQALTFNFDKCIICSIKYFKEIYKIVNIYLDASKICYILDLINENSFINENKIYLTGLNHAGKCLQYSKIYVVSPIGIHSGGVELLHQLVQRLNDIGRNAFIAYSRVNTKEKLLVFSEYKKYIRNNAVAVDEIDDTVSNLIIIPETMTEITAKFKFAQIYLWWLSVDNFFYTFDRKFKDGLSRVSMNLYQSEYAKMFLENLHVDNKAPLSDYLDEQFCVTQVDDSHKKDIVLYNPSKGYCFTQYFLERNPDLKYKALINMTRDEMYRSLREAKVYIDFGNHPGKDRIPREAAVSGCCVITGLRGAAKNELDIQIPSCFKFAEDSDQIENIRAIIDTCMIDYNCMKDKYKDYVRKILDEKNIFNKQVEAIFG